jgi:hypothetical protein
MSDINALARQVAAALGDGWQAGRDDWQTTLYHVDTAAELHLTLLAKYHATPPARCAVAGLYPDRRGGDEVTAPVYGMERPQITVALSRGPAAIAAEIRRRLLPDYYTTCAAVRQVHAQRAADKAARDALVVELHAILPNAWQGQYPSRDGSTVVGWRGSQGHLSGRVRFVGAADEVEIDARVPRAVALAMLRAVSVLTECSGY